MLVAAFLILAVLRSVSASCDIVFVTRRDWGARYARPHTIIPDPVPHIFIHHTQTGPCTNINECSRVVRSIQRYHMDERGWDDIGYSFLIGGDGKVYQGRGWMRVGAHTYGFNNKGFGFALIGDFGNNPPPDVMLQTTKKLIECAKNESFVTSDYKVHGHRDGVCTDCPGQALYDIIKTWDNFEEGPLVGYSCRNG